MPSSGSRILIKLPLGDTLWSKFYKCLEIVSRLSFFMLGIGSNGGALSHC